MITPDDITDSMLSQFHATQIAVNSGEYAKAVIAASVNAYLASSPACAAGEELLATVKRVALDCVRDTAHVEESGSEEIAYLELDAEQWRKHCEAIIQAERVWEKAREAKAKGSTP